MTPQEKKTVKIRTFEKISNLRGGQYLSPALNKIGGTERGTGESPTPSLKDETFFQILQTKKKGRDKQKHNPPIKGGKQSSARGSNPFGHKLGSQKKEVVNETEKKKGVKKRPLKKRHGQWNTFFAH